jgi:hypothetical protein
MQRDMDIPSVLHVLEGSESLCGILKNGEVMKYSEKQISLLDPHQFAVLFTQKCLILMNTIKNYPFNRTKIHPTTKYINHITKYVKTELLNTMTDTESKGI